MHSRKTSRRPAHINKALGFKHLAFVTYLGWNFPSFIHLFGYFWQLGRLPKNADVCFSNDIATIFLSLHEKTTYSSFLFVQTDYADTVCYAKTGANNSAMWEGGDSMHSKYIYMYEYISRDGTPSGILFTVGNLIFQNEIRGIW
jgi:hypothetical protein